METEVVRKLRDGRVVMRSESSDYVEIQIIAVNGFRIGQPISVRKPHVDGNNRLVSAKVNHFSGTHDVYQLDSFLKGLEVALDEARLLNEQAFLSSENSLNR